MNETKKQIIELIEPYMDKILSEGCLIYEFFAGKRIDKIVKILEINNEDNYYYSSSDITEEAEIRDSYNRLWFDIIGHYDITAVLKYIDKSYRDYRGIPQGNILVELTQGDIHINIGEDLYKIPNKPLHLYSEQEEKDLLELLQTIGKN